MEIGQSISMTLNASRLLHGCFAKEDKPCLEACGVPAGPQLTLWDEPLRAAGEDVPLAALHLDPPLLGKGGPVMHLGGSRQQGLRDQCRERGETTLGSHPQDLPAAGGRAQCRTAACNAAPASSYWASGC